MFLIDDLSLLGRWRKGNDTFFVPATDDIPVRASRVSSQPMPHALLTAGIEPRGREDIVWMFCLAPAAAISAGAFNVFCRRGMLTPTSRCAYALRLNLPIPTFLGAIAESKTNMAYNIVISLINN